MNVSIGVFAHNEIDNLATCINSLLKQQLTLPWQLREIVIVVSGSTDGTDRAALKLAQKHKQVQAVIQPQRLGKVAAVNKFLRVSKSRYLIITNADNAFAKNCLMHLLAATRAKNVGMTCGQVVPQNETSSFFNYASHLQWYLLHKMNLQFPDHVKAGELVAFKRFFHRINTKSPFDEASIEGLIRAQGFDIKYVPEAIVYNWGPDNLLDFMKLRKRNNAGHLLIRKTQGYTVSTMSPLKIIGVFLANWDYLRPKFGWVVAIIVLEIFSRLWARWDVFIKKKKFHQWLRIDSAKKKISLR